jgi:hypothetical protein
MAGIETVQGLRLEKYEGDHQAAKVTTCLAPELGCLTVKEHHWWKDASGKITSTTFTEAIKSNSDITTRNCLKPRSISARLLRPRGETR